MILELKELETAYGISQVLFGVNMQVDVQESVCLLGRNGVGKSTTIKTIMGLLAPTKGSITFNGKSIGGLEPFKINRLGISYVPQGRHVFPTLTVKENLIFNQRKGSNAGESWDLDKIFTLFPRLKERINFMGSSLSGGERQMLVIGRALMQNPKLILLDEITEGLAPIVVQELEEVIAELKREGVAILLAEQNAKFALATSDRCYIMEKGVIVHEGRTNEIGEDVFLKYLGT